MAVKASANKTTRNNISKVSVSSVFPSFALSLSLSLSHTHTHIQVQPSEICFNSTDIDSLSNCGPGLRGHTLQSTKHVKVVNLNSVWGATITETLSWSLIYNNQQSDNCRQVLNL